MYYLFHDYKDSLLLVLRKPGISLRGMEFPYVYIFGVRSAQLNGIFLLIIFSQLAPHGGTPAGRRHQTDSLLRKCNIRALRPLTCLAVALAKAEKARWNGPLPLFHDM